METAILFLASAAPILLPIAALLILWGIKKLADKLGWKRSAAMDAAIESIVKKGVVAAEEWARKHVEEQKAKPAGIEKKTQAVAVILSELEAAGITKVAAEVIHDKIEKVLKDEKTV